jgi:outer membrane protein OmpA-like peptidoglycan-associated protein
MIGSNLGRTNMLLEKRKHTRTDIFLIIHFRQIHNPYEYAMGISRNCSDKGFCMESHDFDCKPGQIMECTMKHLASGASISILGEIVWKKDGWYNAVMGIQFLQSDENNVMALRTMLQAGQKESAPACAEGPAFSTKPENLIRNIITSTAPSQKTETRTLPMKKTLPDMPVPATHSTRPYRPYFWFVLFLVLSAVIIFSIAERDGKNVFPWVNFARQTAESLLPGQIDAPAAVASFGLSAIVDNARESPSAEKSGAPVPQDKAVPSKDLVREEISFDVNSADISPEFHPEIDKVADILLGSPVLIVKLEGHTDDAGPELYNMDLSTRRAAAVRRELIKRGIDASRIKLVCFGQSSPAASNDTESGRMKNRRVEIAIPLSQS